MENTSQGKKYIQISLLSYNVWHERWKVNDFDSKMFLWKNLWEFGTFINTFCALYRYRWVDGSYTHYIHVDGWILRSWLTDYAFSWVFNADCLILQVLIW